MSTNESSRMTSLLGELRQGREAARDELVTRVYPELRRIAAHFRYPLRNLRFNQSVLAMLAPWNVDAIGAPERLSPLMVPALKLNGFTFTSLSDAI
jgi:hypothetical protein